jgi:hypothetical protein
MLKFVVHPQCWKAEGLKSVAWTAELGAQ